jgi:hypothetical protein
MALNARIHHYGFFLAFAATVALTVFLVSDLPRRIAARGGSRRLLSATMVAMLTVLAGRFIVESNGYYQQQTFAVGAGGDRMLTYAPELDARTRSFVEALALIDSLPPDATIQAMPEGVMLNYLTRRVTPSSYTNFMATEMSAFGEDAMLDDISRARPDYVVVMHKNTAEYGVGYFGSDDDYGRSIMEWTHANYTRVFLAGAKPLRSPLFGIEILARNER